MLTFTAFTTFLALAATVLAMPSKRWSAKSLDITNFYTHYETGGTDSMSFALTNPDPAANTSTVCIGTWPHNKAAGQQLHCGRDYRASVTSFDGYDDYLLHFTSYFHDPSVGQPDFVTVFADTRIEKPAIECDSTTGEESLIDCYQPDGTTIEAPITSAIAKA